MKNSIILLALIFLCSCQKEDKIIEDPDPMEDSTYFPPLTSSNWATIDSDSLGWNATALEDLKTFMVDTKSRAIIILKEGKIAFEHYEGNGVLGGTFNKDTNWYWASAGKTLTSFLVGQAQADGFLDINNSSSDYLGQNWSTLTETQESAISVRHHLTMTSGLDDKSVDVNCTDPECLIYMVDPGQRWAYHNAPYTRLDGVIEGATGEVFDDYFNRKLRDPIGMDGFWSYLDYNHVYWSTPRAMARFGLINLRNGEWEGQKILNDSAYFTQMTTQSQTINESYGYLWWLNGYASHMLPGLQFEFPGSIAPDAPSDLIAGIGKNGQFVCVVPSQDLVVVRMGENPDLSLVPVNFFRDLWDHINLITGN